jgi:hypothetical protein
MPCLIKMKYIPLVMLIFCLLLAAQMFLPLLIAFSLGFLQFMHLKRRLIKLPIKFYKKLDLLLPKSITERNDYVKVISVENGLRGECSGGNASAGNADVQNNRNPFANNNNNNI